MYFIIISMFSFRQYGGRVTLHGLIYIGNYVGCDCRTQVVGWPPVRSYRKSCFQSKKTDSAEAGGMYVKVSMDGAPYLRKIDLKGYKGYPELLKVLEEMFKFSVGKYHIYVYIYHHGFISWIMGDWRGG